MFYSFQFSGTDNKNNKNNILIYRLLYLQMAKTNKKKLTHKLKKITNRSKGSRSVRFTRSKRSTLSSSKKIKAKSNSMDIKGVNPSKSNIILSNLEKKKEGTLSNIHYRYFGLASRASRY